MIVLRVLGWVWIIAGLFIILLFNALTVTAWWWEWREELATNRRLVDEWSDVDQEGMGTMRLLPPDPDRRDVR